MPAASFDSWEQAFNLVDWTKVSLTTLSLGAKRTPSQLELLLPLADGTTAQVLFEGTGFQYNFLGIPSGGTVSKGTISKGPLVLAQSAFQPTSLLTIQQVLLSDLGDDNRLGQATLGFLRSRLDLGPLPSLALTAQLATQSEGNTGTQPFTFVVTRTGNTAGESSALWSVAGSGANPTNAADFFGATTGTVSFAAGDSSRTLTIQVNGDTTEEPNETFALTLTGANGATLSTPTALGTINNDDTAGAPPPVIRLAVSPAAVPEDGLANLIYTFTRTGPTTSPLTVNVTVAGTALAIDPVALLPSLPDYTGIEIARPSNTVNFAPGAATATVVVNPTADTTAESNETVSLTLASGTGYTIGTPVAVTGTILNDDLIGTAANDTRKGSALPEFIDGRQGQDTLTGGLTKDVFGFSFGHSTISAPDRITDFRIGVDKIDLLTAGGAALPAPAGFSRASNNTTAKTLSDLAAAVFRDANGSLRGNQALGANRAAVVVATRAPIAGTYLFINNSNAARDNRNDLLINITGVSGVFPALGAIPVGTVFA
jgi:Ca2+-binding RTX toxin-like protein